MSTTSTAVKKGELFVKEVLSRLVGDDKDALAAKIARKSISAVQGQVAALEAKEVNDEMGLEEATETLNNAMYPTTLPSDNKVYIDNIVHAQTKVDEAQDELDDTKDSIVFYKDLLAKF